MGVRRPWKMRFHYDGTKVASGDPEMLGAYTIDTTRPIDAVSAHADREVAEDAAQMVSRNGGRASVSYRDPATGVETVVATYAPFEVALAELTAEVGGEHG